MTRIFYYIKQGLIQIFRNRGMSVVSIFSILAMLLILGIFFMVTINLNLFAEAIKQNYDQVEVFLKDDVTEEKLNAMQINIRAQEGVKETEYRSKDDALKILKERWGSKGYLLDGLGDNPLPASIVVTVTTLESADGVADFVENMEGVEDINFYKDTVNTLTTITNFMQIAALIIMAALIVVCVVVVSNTVKLTVFARSREIHIMKYVGATNWFIRGPFLIEGILIGLIGAGISIALATYLYKTIIDTLGPILVRMFSAPLIPVEYMTENIAIVFVALGCSIGAWGSIVSIRRFLDT